MELRKHTEEASNKVSAVLRRAEEQGRMIESLHTSVSSYYGPHFFGYAYDSRSMTWIMRISFSVIEEWENVMTSMSGTSIILQRICSYWN